MAGSGELFKGDDGKWAFRVKASNGKVVATDGGPPGYKTISGPVGALEAAQGRLQRAHP